MVTIRYRDAPGEPWREEEFRTNAAAEAFAKARPRTGELSWGGFAEEPDPCAS